MEGYTAWLVMAAIAVFAYAMLRPPCNFYIDVGNGQVDVGGKALAGRHGDVSEFFERDLPGVARLRVRGYWNGRQLRLSYRGNLLPAHRQRIRNFLLMTLCVPRT
jgi:hypothetical protein